MIKMEIKLFFSIGPGFVSARLWPVCGCCDYVNEPTAMMKIGECFDQLSKCWLTKEELVLVFVQSILPGLRQSH